MDNSSHKNLEDLRYPIGHYEPVAFSETKKRQWLVDLESLPALLELSVLNLDEAQLQTPYREGGWTVHQLIHHVADSHINGYTRCKLCLTEEHPSIKSYDRDLWALMEDTRTLPVNISLTLLHALHLRWVKIFTGLQDAQWKRTVFFPQNEETKTLWALLGQYSWHGRHHVAHITGLRERLGW